MKPAFTFREPVPADVPALARLHVVTWNATYPDVKTPPTFEIRERQWREAFETIDGSWFAYVIENAAGELIGFTKANRYTHPDPPGFTGQLNKIYVLREYQRQGLGRRFVGLVARRFLSMGIHAMILFSEADNPSIAFYDALGGERLLADNGEFHGGYGWRDLAALAASCPVE